MVANASDQLGRIDILLLAELLFGHGVAIVDLKLRPPWTEDHDVQNFELILLMHELLELPARLSILVARLELSGIMRIIQLPCMHKTT